MTTLQVTDDYDLGTEIPADPSEVRAAWVRELRSGRYEQDTNRYLRHNNERCVFGVLCEVCQDMGLISLTESEWERELPPYSVLLIAGVEFSRVVHREADGRDVDEIYRFADRPGRTHAEVASMVEQLYESRNAEGPRSIRIDYFDTPGLGGTGVGYLDMGGNVFGRSKKRRI